MMHVLSHPIALAWSVFVITVGLAIMFAGTRFDVIFEKLVVVVGVTAILIQGWSTIT